MIWLTNELMARYENRIKLDVYLITLTSKIRHISI